MSTFWILVAVTLQLGSQWVAAKENIKTSPRSSGDDVIAIAQHRSPPIYRSMPGVYPLEYNGQQSLTCDLCEPGHFLVKHCDTEHGTICEQCPHNFYMRYYNNGDRCLSCGDTCDDDRNLVTLQECSPTAPRRCDCKPGTRQVYRGSNGPAMCSPVKTGTGTTDSKHGNATSLRNPDHNETTQKTTTSTSSTGNTTKWDLDSSLANDTLSYDLAESESFVVPLAGGLASLAGIAVAAVVIVACCKDQSTPNKETESNINKNVDLRQVFNYVADHVGSRWSRLARHLPGNLPTQADLDSIYERHRPDVKEMAFQMLLKWKQMNGNKASLEGLQQGLRRSFHPIIARQVGKMQWPEMV
ncbi:tumor necrosis factor receptor superfamily member 11B-like [Branchiostoma floridae]|uniref:Tumor necrosis factor receptor superfamily member 11B-like n=1 Tax=Branchiostoma floridae TaxID=7739 RepID=A0A9J7M7T9_BRAFL|nr:tumor necrosis factor receptor superfamily member 11B-like [Branchiostoma floridae]